MDIGTCVGCGVDDLELNEDGYCTDCAELEGDDKDKEDDLEMGDLEEEG